MCFLIDFLETFGSKFISKKLEKELTQTGTSHRAFGVFNTI